MCSSDLGRSWYWWSERVETEIPGFFRYEIVVSDEEDGEVSPIHTLDGYLAQEQSNDAQ